MKNLFIALGAIALLGATSCKKEYTCTCTYDSSGELFAPAKTIKAKKSKAQKECDKTASVSVLGLSAKVEGVTCVVK